MKRMEEPWDNIQSGKIKRKDIIQRFISEVGLTPKGASTYFGNCKKKLAPKQINKHLRINSKSRWITE